MKKEIKREDIYKELCRACCDYGNSDLTSDTKAYIVEYDNEACIIEVELEATAEAHITAFRSWEKAFKDTFSEWLMGFLSDEEDVERFAYEAYLDEYAERYLKRHIGGGI